MNKYLRTLKLLLTTKYIKLKLFSCSYLDVCIVKLFKYKAVWISTCMQLYSVSWLKSQKKIIYSLLTNWD